MKVLVPSDVPPRRLDQVRAVGGGIDVTSFSVEAQRPCWARALGALTRRCLPHRLRRAAATQLRAVHRPALVPQGRAAEGGAEVLLATASLDARLVARIVEALPALRWIHSTTTGVERFALGHLASRGIRLTAPRGVHSRRVAEFVTALVYCEAKRLEEHWRRARNGGGGALRATELADLTMGVVGYGSIGREVARLAMANGIRVLAHDRAAEHGAAPTGVEIRGLRDLLGACDVVVLALPLTDETRGLVSRDALRSIRRGAVLVNVGRAGTIDEEALAAALRDGTVRRAYLDVLDDEDDDVPAAHPLRRSPHVLYTHHSAAASPRSDDEVFAGFLANLRRYCAGQPLEGRVELDVPAPLTMGAP
jgi:phosphoglycerate dehydrogenase-like enzyme